ncbi:hypothetical protein F4780DRAFT_778686 [Xylariomycetidae sp. FL0641]|nr:hypothetical protein F4780DRAFT_778686 [Xylariomycetidae sp. FL0641]
MKVTTLILFFTSSLTALARPAPDSLDLSPDGSHPFGPPANLTLPDGVVGDNAYMATCNAPTIFPASGGRWVIQVECKKKHSKKMRCTQLDLNRCYKNDGSGHVVADPSGGFISSCGACRLGEPWNSQLGCVCNENPNEVAWTDLNADLSNDDGYIMCFDKYHRGTETCGRSWDA